MLGLSDSGVSRAVARLEARLGVDRSLRLTGEGGRFYAEDATSSRTRRLRYQRPPGGAWPLGVEIDPFFSRLVLALRLGDLLERAPTYRSNSSPPRHRETSLPTALTWEYASARPPASG
jgi:DNA-binding transcriptional LysR family regulator